MPQPGTDREPITYTFRHEEPEIVLTVVPADMNKYRAQKQEFDLRFPIPQPPLIRVVTFESALDPDGPGYREMPDMDDEEYKKAMVLRGYLIFMLALKFFMSTCLRATTQRDTMMIARLHKADIAVKQAFVEFIISISEITWQAISKRMEELDYKWGDKPLHEISTPSTPGKMPVRDALLQMAAQSYMLTEEQVDQMTVAQQVDMMARGILWAKLNYLTEKKRADEAEQKIKQQQQRRRGRR